jgi:cardiolipin synthase (CMP-forming)
VEGPRPIGQQIRMVPNLISLARLAGVPLFLWLFLGLHADVWAVAVLALGGSSDWVDGYLARRLGQVSRLGELLDPMADRLYILATLLALTVREVVPVQLTVAILAREAVLLACLPVLRRYGYGPPPVHYLGKTATFVLLVAFPMLLLAYASDAAAVWAHPVGWGLAWWGVVLYWIAGLLYVVQVAAVVRRARAEPA